VQSLSRDAGEAVGGRCVEKQRRQFRREWRIRGLRQCGRQPAILRRLRISPQLAGPAFERIGQACQAGSAQLPTPANPRSPAPPGLYGSPRAGCGCRTELRPCARPGLSRRRSSLTAGRRLAAPRCRGDGRLIAPGFEGAEELEAQKAFSLHDEWTIRKMCRGGKVPVEAMV
jgi:hypothetical protein